LLKVQGNCADNYAPSGGLINGASIYLTNVSSVNILRWLDDGGGDPDVTVVVPNEVDDTLPYKGRRPRDLARARGQPDVHT
jgi:hypothetical protein